jgi:hypothetical protein
MIRIRQGRKSSFLKKRSKKLLTFGSWQLPTRSQKSKVFWFFLSKKNFLLFLPFALPASAAVKSTSPTGFQVVETAQVAVPPARAYAALRDIGRWWSSAHSFSGDALNLTLDLVPGGCLCERLPRGGGVRHLDVVFVKPGEMVVLRGALGPLMDQGLSGGMAIMFTPTGTPAGSGTAITLTYTVGGYFADPKVNWAAAVDRVLGEQVGRLARFINTGRPDGVAAPLQR